MRSKSFKGKEADFNETLNAKNALDRGSGETSNMILTESRNRTLRKIFFLNY